MVSFTNRIPIDTVQDRISGKYLRTRTLNFIVWLFSNQLIKLDTLKIMSQTHLSTNLTCFGEAKKPLKRKRQSSIGKEKVHFSLNNTTYLQTLSPSSMTELERSNTWYLPHEIEQFRSSYRTSILNSDTNNIEPCYVEYNFRKGDQNKDCAMINVNSKNVLIYRQKRKIIALNAVLEAQKRIMQCISDESKKDHELACISDQFTFWSRALARRVGVSNYHSAVSDDL